MSESAMKHYSSPRASAAMNLGYMLLVGLILCSDITRIRQRHFDDSAPYVHKTAA